MEKNTGPITQRVLAVETSGRAFSVALAESRGDMDSVLAETFFEAGHRHSDLLKDSCLRLLEGCGLEKNDLTALAVSTGPGSFTGLRVGIAFTRALSQALGLPLIGVPTPDVIARAVRQHRTEKLAVVIGSIGDEVFASQYGSGSLRLLKPCAALAFPKFLKNLDKRAPLICAGDGVARRAADLKKHMGRRWVDIPEELRRPRASHLALLALRTLRGKSPAPESWKRVTPLYLRPPVAVERLNYRKKLASKTAKVITGA